MKLFSKVLLASWLMHFSISHAAPQVSQQQIAQFKQLPKAQQQALAKQYGVNLNELNQGASAKKITNPKVVTERAVDNVVVTDVDKGLNSATNLKSDGDAKKQGKKTRILKPFGYELFASSPSTFAPATDVPVPSEYVLGPGDTIKIQLFGKEYKNYELSVDRNGTITMPETGPLPVVGMNFSELKSFMSQQIEEKVIGAKVNVTMGDLRSIRIFVLGEAYKPGAYTVSSLSSITHALFVSGGITEVGSLRNIQLKRKGRVITTFDLYDLLLKGDTANDTTLLPGDVVFIPPVGDTAGIDGEVKRPAIYELKNNNSITELIALAGGYLPTAYAQASKIERIANNGERTVVDVDLTQKQSQQVSLMNGDVLRVYSILDSRENVVSIEGHVQRPGAFAWHKGIRISDLITNVRDLKIDPDLAYAIVVREQQPLRTISAIHFSLGKVLENRNSEDNLVLAPRDKVYVFGANQARLLPQVLAKLKSQARSTEPEKIVAISGHVEFPAAYPLTKAMTVADLLVAAHDIKQEADLDYLLLQRRNQELDRIEFETLSLRNEQHLALKLQAQDKLYVFGQNASRVDKIADVVSKIQAQKNKENRELLVNINGEVRFPGTYPLSNNMTLAQLVSAAGGYTEASYLKEMQISRFDSNLVDSSELILETIKLADTNLDSYQLQARDSVSVKKIPEWQEQKTVTLMGEFIFPGKYTIREGENLAQLIKRAGGFTDKAFLNASIFTRSYLKNQEQALLDNAEKKLRRELISSQINAGASTNAETVLAMLDQLQTVQATGRMIINQEQLIDLEQSVKLRDGDVLIIPRINQAVSVIGEVYAPTAHIHNSAWCVDDYIAAAGGFNQLAESSDVYIIKANGRVVSNIGWLSFDDAVEPGDTIIVPTNVDPIPALTIWKDVTSIIYQSTVAIAAVAAL